MSGLFNQGLFERVEIDSEEVSDYALAEPFRELQAVVRETARSRSASRKVRTPAISSKGGGSYHSS
jgi:hypothetical protein